MTTNDMSIKYDEILAMRASGYVRRWHTLTTLRQQNDAEHSAQAATLLILLHPDPPLHLVKAMLWHDYSERVVGDVPAPVRRKFPAFAEMYEQIEQVVAMEEQPTRAAIKLTEDETKWLKAIDVLELFLWCREEIKLGNSQFHHVYLRAHRYLNSDTMPTQVLEFVEWFMREGDKRSFA